jgi:hypothetical protein
MSDVKPDAQLREFNADDARVIARSIIESDAGRECQWSPAAVDTAAAIIFWEVLARGLSNEDRGQ